MSAALGDGLGISAQRAVTTGRLPSVTLSLVASAKHGSLARCRRPEASRAHTPLSSKSISRLNGARPCTFKPSCTKQGSDGVRLQLPSGGSWPDRAGRPEGANRCEGALALDGRQPTQSGHSEGTLTEPAPFRGPLHC